MGRNILRRKALAAVSAGFLIFAAAAGSFGEELVFPEEAAAGLSSVTRDPPRFPPDRRSALRSPSAGARASSPVSAPRQFHGGPEVFSPEFAPRERVEYFLDRLERSKTESDRILAALERAVPYADFIREKIQEHGLPPEIFFLPVVESLYKINAHSRSGAMGLWQFMRNSVGSWMRIDEWADERKDFWKSTVAAMEKLEQNHRAVGDWPLALAAYNCGLGRVRQAVRQSGVRDFWELARRGLLPRETRDYVPKLIAVARYASSLGRRGFELSWEKPPRWERIRLDRTVDLRLLAEASGVPHGVLKLGNAELHYGITPPAGYHLKVPVEYREKIRDALEKSDGKLLKFAIHHVAAGHTLSEIAHHYGVPMEMIRRYNPGLRPDLLRIGTKLVIPAYKETRPYVKKAGAAADEGPLLFENEYTVKPGDSLWNIARSFGTTAGRLARANGLDENGVIRPGRTLKVP